MLCSQHDNALWKREGRPSAVPIPRPRDLNSVVPQCGGEYNLDTGVVFLGAPEVLMIMCMQNKFGFPVLHVQSGMSETSCIILPASKHFQKAGQLQIGPIPSTSIEDAQPAHMRARAAAEVEENPLCQTFVGPRLHACCQYLV